jgi:hypothetical protein
MATTKQTTNAGLEKARETANKIKAESEAAKQPEPKAPAPKPAEQIAKEANKQLSPTTPPVTTGRQIGKFTIRKAERSQAKLRLGLAGPSGSGKTYSALLLAKGLASSWDKVAIIDTENGSADLYSEMGPYNVLTLEKPFHPDRYIEAMEAAQEAGMEVIIIDSITHEWSGQGGILETQEKLGGRFQDWAKVTPMHNRFVQTILQSKAHMITTVRSKTDYSLSTEGGKGKVQKVGMKPETREGFEYEMTTSFDLNINNMASISKDRTGIFKNDAAFMITEETGRTLAEWAAGGIDYLTTLNDLLVKKNVDPTILTNYYKVINLSELTTFQFKEAITRLEQRPDFDYEAEKQEKAKAEAEAKAKAEADAKQKAEDEKLAKEATEALGGEEQPNDQPETASDTNVTSKPESEEIDLDEVDAGIQKQQLEK